MYYDSGWTVLHCPDKLENGHELWANETFIFVKKPNVALGKGWKKEENGLLIKLDLPCCIFKENESEEFQHMKA